MGLEDVVEGRKTAMTVAEVAQWLSVSERLVYQLVSIGEIPHFRVGKAVRFEPKALTGWLLDKVKQSGRGTRVHHGSRAGAEGLRMDMTAYWSDVLLPKDGGKV